MMNLSLFSVLLDRLFGPVEGPRAYLDPGSGSILIQILVAAAVGILFVLRTSWGRIRSFFGKPMEDDEENGEDEE